MTPEGRRLSVRLQRPDPPIPLTGFRVAVVDVLRATTVLPVALAAGVSRIIPVATEAEARAHRDAEPSGRGILCGERGGLRIPGFDLGNSPAEYVPARVRGQDLVYLSSNGAPTLLGAPDAPRVIAASFVNASAAVSVLAAGDDDILIIAAGNGGRPCLEDVAGAGCLVNRLRERSPDFQLDDGGEVAAQVWRAWAEDVRGLLARSQHGAELISLGFSADLDLCARIDSVPVVPILRDGALVPHEAT